MDSKRRQVSYQKKREWNHFQRNPCLPNPCQKNSHCQVTQARTQRTLANKMTFKCICEEGFIEIGNTCDDINECEGCIGGSYSRLMPGHQRMYILNFFPGNNHICDPNANCINTSGSYSCICQGQGPAKRLRINPRSIYGRTMMVCRSQFKMDSMVMALPVSILLDQLDVDRSVAHMLFAILG